MKRFFQRASWVAWVLCSFLVCASVDDEPDFPALASKDKSLSAAVVHEPALQPKPNTPAVFGPLQRFLVQFVSEWQQPVRYDRTAGFVQFCARFAADLPPPSYVLQRCL